MRYDSAFLPLYNRARLITALLLVLLTVAVLLPINNQDVLDLFTAYMTYQQDVLLVPLVLIGAVLRPDKAAIGASRREPLHIWVLLAAGGAVVLMGWIGHYLVFQGLNLTRDEQMAVFDQEIYARGRLLWPISQEWQSLADALNRRFILPIGDSEFWVSAYLPGHAAFRALVGIIADPALSSPLLAGLSAICLWVLVRRLWPGSNGTLVLALLLLGTSSQVVITSMTAFSMTMHMALNLLWLALFLQGRWRSHVLAVAVGVLATGLHQPLFHPLFVLPFLWLLVARREWRVLALYLVGYAAICLFWLAWPQWISSHGSSPAVAIRCTDAMCTGPVGYVDRLVSTIGAINARSAWLMAANLLRFLCWQNPLLLPLALFGAVACWRAEPLVRSLSVSLLLPVIVMTIILPWQGYGWGYRYLHPVLGNAILLAAYGFHRLEKAGRSMTRPLVLSSAIAVLLLGLHARMVAQVVAPFAKARDALATVPAEAVIVDTDNVPSAEDLVINRADLSNRPKLLIAKLLRPADMPKLCGLATIAFYDATRLAEPARLFGTPVPTGPSSHLQQLRAAARQANCQISELR